MLCSQLFDFSAQPRGYKNNLQNTMLGGGRSEHKTCNNSHSKKLSQHNFHNINQFTRTQINEFSIPRNLHVIESRITYTKVSYQYHKSPSSSVSQRITQSRQHHSNRHQLIYTITLRNQPAIKLIQTICTQPSSNQTFTHTKTRYKFKSDHQSKPTQARIKNQSQTLKTLYKTVQETTTTKPTKIKKEEPVLINTYKPIRRRHHGATYIKADPFQTQGSLSLTLRF